MRSTSARSRTNIREEYGSSPFANGCLLARRLVERGVRFVHVGSGGWDDHKDIQKNYLAALPDPWTRQPPR